MALCFKKEYAVLMSALLLFHCLWLLKTVCAINMAFGKVIASAIVYDQVNLHGWGIHFSNFAFAEWEITMDIFLKVLFLQGHFWNMLATFQSVSSMH